MQMSFLQSNKNGGYYSQQKKTTSLRKIPYSIKNAQIFQHDSSCNGKRMSAFISHYLPGSMTVESAFVVPLFMFAMISLLSAIDMILLNSNLTMAMHQTGKEMATNAYAYNQVRDEKNEIEKIASSVVFSNLYARTQVVQKVGKEYLNQSVLVGGEDGISFIQSKVMADKEDLIDLVAYYKVSPLIRFPGFQEFYMVNRCRMRAWTGYDNTKNASQESKEELVYITETGTVYHKSRNCTHLSLSIRTVRGSEISFLHNQSGEIYRCCELCGKKEDGFFITNQGNRYHSSIRCSGLKRTISVIPISKIGNRTLCTRCGI